LAAKERMTGFKVLAPVLGVGEDLPLPEDALAQL